MPRPLTFSYLIVPQSARHVRNSSKSIDWSLSAVPTWHVTKAPLHSIHERLQCTGGKKRPVMLGVGVTLRSSDTLRSESSSQKTSIPRVEPRPSSSASLPKPCVVFLPAFPNPSLVPDICVASFLHTISNCSRRAA